MGNFVSVLTLCLLSILFGYNLPDWWHKDNRLMLFGAGVLLAALCWFTSQPG